MAGFGVEEGMKTETVVERYAAGIKGVIGLF